MKRPRWRVVVHPAAWAQIYAAPWDPQLLAKRWIFRRLCRNPFPQGRAVRRGTKLHGRVDPIRAGQRRNRRVHHVRLGGLWRLNYVILPRHRAVFVYECVEHVRGGKPLYDDAHIREVLAAARAAFRKNPTPAVAAAKEKARAILDR